MNRDQIEHEYESRHEILEITAQRILADLREILHGIPHVDGITARAKSINRFVDKALKLDKDGNRKYQHPFDEIQDQVGARIVVFYLSDVDEIAERVYANYRPAEDVEKRDEKPEQFSYQARHFVCRIPPDIRASAQTPVGVFELQISTLFQHAWAEANHDIAYKPEHPLEYNDRRRLAWAAAQAWGADVIFDELLRSQQESPQN